MPQPCRRPAERLGEISQLLGKLAKLIYHSHKMSRFQDIMDYSSTPDVGTAIRKSIVVLFLPCLVTFIRFHPYILHYFCKCFFVTFDWWFHVSNQLTAVCLGHLGFPLGP